MERRDSQSDGGHFISKHILVSIRLALSFAHGVTYGRGVSYAALRLRGEGLVSQLLNERQ